MTDKSQNLSKGNWGETLAAHYLVGQGYAILERKWRMGHFEIDIVAQKGSQIVFVEVKTRASESSDPIGAVNSRKRSRMVSSADAYIRQYDIPFEYRFDIITIIGTTENYKLEHLPDAFVPSLRRINFSFRL